MQDAGVHQLVNGATGLKARVEGQPWVRPTQATRQLLVEEGFASGEIRGELRRAFDDALARQSLHALESLTEATRPA